MWRGRPRGQLKLCSNLGLRHPGLLSGLDQPSQALFIEVGKEGLRADGGDPQLMKGPRRTVVWRSN
jgi:hypothetical protein